MIGDQLTLMRQQAIIIEQQLSKVAKLEMRAEPVGMHHGNPVSPMPTFVFNILVENIGTKKADGFTWHLGVQHVDQVGFQVSSLVLPCQISILFPECLRDLI